MNEVQKQSCPTFPLGFVGFFDFSVKNVIFPRILPRSAPVSKLGLGTGVVEYDHLPLGNLVEIHNIL